MNAATTEALARWMAGVLGDNITDNQQCVWVTTHLDGGLRLVFTFSEYTSCMNVAGRLFKVLSCKAFDDGGMDGLTDFQPLAKAFVWGAFKDTPAALLALAVACGFDREKEEVR